MNCSCNSICWTFGSYHLCVIADPRATMYIYRWWTILHSRVFDCPNTHFEERQTNNKNQYPPGVSELAMNTECTKWTFNRLFIEIGIWTNERTNQIHYDFPMNVWRNAIVHEKLHLFFCSFVHRKFSTNERTNEHCSLPTLRGLLLAFPWTSFLLRTDFSVWYAPMDKVTD